MLYPKNDVCDHKGLFPETANLRNVNYVYERPIPVSENLTHSIYATEKTI